jgi:hypothetical protein
VARLPPHRRRFRAHMPLIRHVSLVFTMRAQGPFRHNSRIGPESWRTQPASAGS